MAKDGKARKVAAPLFGADGSRSGEVELPAALFAAPTNGAVVHQAVVAALANARAGTAATKNRSRVSGGGAKPFRQKGTGRARAGSTRAPHWRHGAVVFGPNGRVYEQRLPKKMRKLAFAAALSASARDHRVAVLEELRPSAEADGGPRTKAALELLERLGLKGDVVIVAARHDDAVARAFANVPGVALRTPRSLRLVDVLVADNLVLEKAAIAELEKVRA